MKKLIWIAALALTPLVAIGCAEPLETCDEECTWETEEETKKPALHGTFISGHLGNYQDCPSDGYEATSESSTSTGSDSGDVSGEFAGAPACDPDADDCDGGGGGYALNCEDGQMTIRLSNTGEDHARQLQVARIELFDGQGNSLAVVPLIDVLEVGSGESFDGLLPKGEELDLRIDFQGPSNPYSLSEYSDDARESGILLKLTITAENHDDVTIETTEVYAIPSVAT